MLIGPHADAARLTKKDSGRQGQGTTYDDFSSQS
jgi:hypothetical protein